MIKAEYRQWPGHQAVASSPDFLPLGAMEDVFASRSNTSGIGQPHPEFDQLTTSNKFGRGLLNGLAISTVIWALIIASIWQHMHP